MSFKSVFPGLFILSCALAIAVRAQDKRPLTPDDLYKLEKIGPDFAVSTDGHTLAYVQARPPAYGGYKWPHLCDRCDVWLTPLVGGGTPINLTNGYVDGNRYFNPVWSPDGEHLALLSTKGGESLQLWIWGKNTGQLRQLSDRSIRFDPARSEENVKWIDNRRLLVTLLPRGEQQPNWLDFTREAKTVLTREWSKVSDGRYVTASVLDTTPPSDETHPQQEVTLIDISGRARLVESAPQVSDLSMSPDRQHIAIVKRAGWLPPNPGEGPMYNYHMNGGASVLGYYYQLTIADMNGKVLVTSAESNKWVVPGSFRWSHDGRKFAFIGLGRNSNDYDKDSLQVFWGEIEGAIDAVSLPELDPKALIWAEGNRLLISAVKNNRMDWWLVSPKVAPRNMTLQQAATPETLLPIGSSFVGLTAGDVWRLDLDSAKWTNLTAGFEPKISTLWQNEVDSSLLVAFSREGKTEYGRLDPNSGRIAGLLKPSSDADLKAYSRANDVAVYSTSNRSGSTLTAVQGKQVRPIVETNGFLEEIAEGALRRIDYRGLDGQDLIGWIILPANYETGKRYPVVTLVYAEIQWGEKPPNRSINDNYPVNVQLLAARGYAVLLPSMPLEQVPRFRNDHAGSDTYLELTKGVLPAVEKVIEMGIADPKRLAVMGWSYGGFSTYGLITQTNRFKAAITVGGYTDFLSVYGTFNGDMRYNTYPVIWNVGRNHGEGGQIRLGVPPWKDIGRYLRNSPIVYVDRVQTPVLIVQGDLDFIPIQQGEEFFTALQRQGKRARFIRYWGEYHWPASRANARDMWMQFYAWLDEFCDIARDAKGNLIFDEDKVKSRNGAPPLKPEDFVRFNEMEIRTRPWYAEDKKRMEGQEQAHE